MKYTLTAKVTKYISASIDSNTKEEAESAVRHELTQKGFSIIEFIEVDEAELISTETKELTNG